MVPTEDPILKERLVSEPLKPLFTDPGKSDESGANEFQAVGEPLLPERFTWRGEELAVAEVLERWKEYSRPGAAMQERYLRKHWYRIRTAAGREMKIYFERQARSKAGAKQRWWVYSVFDSE
ncbi:MAG TPA: DUF6504 family protein [Candidatus Eisenbacteria bacterium]|nr:DUF6504 family protein [Candidatus Eisenbacteria bacterium]